MTQSNETTQGVKTVLSSMRRHNRRTVVQQAHLSVGNYDFDCTVYDISLGGIRLKVDMPIESGTSVYVQLRDKITQAAKVIWSANGFLGLRFEGNPEKVKMGLGNLANGLT